MVSKFRAGGFDSVHSIMPKTGLLTMIAAKVAGVPIRIHMFTGQVWVTRCGVWKTLLKSADRFIARLATVIYTDSPSQRDFLIGEKVILSGSVLCDGSVNGVDCDRFKPNLDARKRIRDQFGISKDGVVLGFMGRLTRDKGLLDLAKAFVSADVISRAYLLLVGPDEEGIEELVRREPSAAQEHIYFAGLTSEPEYFYAAFDVFCIPSYREGFGSAAVEAGACGVPALASRIYGLTDAVAEGETGLMHEPGSVAGIRNGIERYVRDSAMRQRYGANARRRVLEKFTTQRLVDAMVHEYRELLNDPQCTQSGEI